MSAARSIAKDQTHRLLTTLAWLTVLTSLGCAAPAFNRPVIRQDVIAPDTGRELPQLDPQWTFDAPQYARPESEPDPEFHNDVNEPLHFYLSSRTLHIRRPLQQDPQEPPRVAIAVTSDGGATWKRIGYFGRGQTFFPYIVDHDGDYGIRIEPAESNQAARTADRIYHVDATPPRVELSMTPDTTVLSPGQTVTLAWKVEDRFLLERPVQVSISTAQGDWRVLSPEQNAAGSLVYTATNAGESQVMGFRVEALDRAGNIGLGHSPTLTVLAGRSITTVANAADALPNEPSLDELNAAYVYVPCTPEDAIWLDWPPCEDDSPASNTEIVSVEFVPSEPSLDLTMPAERRLALVPALPAIESDSIDQLHDSERPWQELRRAHGSLSRAMVWSLPRPRFLSELARFVDAQWRQANVSDLAAVPPTPELDPIVVRAGDATEPPADGPVTP